ncbi:MAG: gamma-glutamyltransferase [Thermomicrobiales bacterium]
MKTSCTTWRFDRDEAISRSGMVAAKHPLAAAAGVEVLREGGNAVDAAVTAAFCAGVVEPFMSGIGGGGFLVAHFPASGKRILIDHGMVAPRAAIADMYPLASGSDSSLFGWPSVVDSTNIIGHRAAAVPGAVAGLSLTLERFGTVPLARALAPAIHYAEEGFPVSWHTTLNIATDLATLNRFPATRAIFTDQGNPPNPYRGIRKPLRQIDLARTLRTIAAEGGRAFYEGAIATKIAAEMRAHGGLIDEHDLASYEPSVSTPLMGTYRGRTVLTARTASGGPTVLETLNLMEGADLAAMGHNAPGALHQIAESCRQAMADRLAWLADPEFVDVPLDAMIGKSYAARQRATFSPDRARLSVSPGDFAASGKSAGPAPSEPGGRAPRMTTTHVSAIDRAGNSVSLTTTLLGGWGCGVTVPETGILLNNGMMWFDPVPGRPNSIAGGKKPLANMAPVIVLSGNQPLLTLGAMGGRFILNALPQIMANVIDYGMSMQAAITAPRIDYSTGIMLTSDRIPEKTVAAMMAMGHQVESIEEDVIGFDFGSPVGIQVDGDTLRGGANPYYPAMALGLY